MICAQYKKSSPLLVVYENWICVSLEPMISEKIRKL